MGGNHAVQLYRGCFCSPPRAPFRVLLELSHPERVGPDRLRHLGLPGPSQGHAAEDPPQHVEHHPDDFRPRSCQLGLCNDCQPSWETEAERGMSGLTLLARVTPPISPFKTALCHPLENSKKLGRRNSGGRC